MPEEAAIRRSSAEAQAAHLLNLLQGYRASCVIAAAVRMGVLERIDGETLSSDELAHRLRADPSSLRRFLRALEALDLVESGPNGVALTPTGRLLLDPQTGLRERAMLIGDQYLPAWIRLDQSVISGEPAFPTVFGMSVWEHRKAHPELDASFNRAMATLQARAESPAVSGYDFSGCRLIVDVGGGSGALLVDILQRYPDATGLLFDQPHVAEAAQTPLSTAGVLERCRIAGGSFLDSVPAGGDVYILQYILHDWSDSDCATILRHCREAMGPSSVLLIIESIVPEGEVVAGALAFLDLHMMVMLGGRERTLTEYRSLLHSAGMEVRRCVPGRPRADIIVAGSAPAERSNPGSAAPYWGSDVAHQWHLYGPPLRPCAADIRVMERAVRAFADERDAPLSVLLWGVTPEIATMSWPAGTRLLALDKSQAMIDLVWPGDVAGFRNAVLVDWFEYRCTDGPHDVVIGDGNFAPLAYPDGYRVLAAAARAALTDTGILITRMFLRPAQPETPQAVFEDLLANRIKSFHTFKFRLAAALQKNAETGVAVADVLAAWKEARIDMNALLAMTGWRRETVEMIYLYEGKTSRLSFPDVTEIEALMSEHFDRVDIRYLDYEMGERCPIITLRVRVDARHSV